MTMDPLPNFRLVRLIQKQLRLLRNKDPVFAIKVKAFNRRRKRHVALKRKQAQLDQLKVIRKKGERYVSPHRQLDPFREWGLEPHGRWFRVTRVPSIPKKATVEADKLATKGANAEIAARSRAPKSPPPSN